VPLPRLGARPAVAAGSLVLADSDPAGLRLRDRFGREEHRRTRRMGRPGRCRDAVGLRNPPPPAQVATRALASDKPLLAPLDLAGAVITFDALHSVQDHAKWLVKTKKAHYIAVIKANQPTALAQISALPWNTIPVQDSGSETGHGRRESRSIKTMAVADNLGGLTFPNAKLALRVHRRRKETGKAGTRETVYAVTSLDAHQATPADLAAWIRGHWAIENSSHHI
jgi:predicted transposase YbfD/YdcC